MSRKMPVTLMRKISTHVDAADGPELYGKMDSKRPHDTNSGWTIEITFRAI